MSLNITSAKAEVPSPVDSIPATTSALPAAPKVKLLDQVRREIRLRHYSLRTEEAYVNWIRRFILFHRKRHPRDMGAAEVRAFLEHLANESQVASATQHQAAFYKQGAPWAKQGRCLGLNKAGCPESPCVTSP